MVFLKTLVNSWYSEEILERSGVSASFAELAWMSEEQKQSWNLLKPRSFYVCRNAVALIIAMLSYSEIDTEVSEIQVWKPQNLMIAKKC